MGGNVWVDNGDGTFTRQGNGFPLASGLSALDLYVMGLYAPSEVPDTFILRDVRETDRWDTVEATKVPVRIEDIVSAMGPRLPAASSSRKEFRLGVYLLHEDGKPPRPEMLERAEGVAEAIRLYFAKATGDRMRVIVGDQGDDRGNDGDDGDDGGDDGGDDDDGHDGEIGPCQADGETLCLQRGRFEVKVDWWTAGGEPAAAIVVPRGTDDSGLFRFFDPTNWEMLIKVLDGCAVNDHHWVYAAATTDLGLGIAVTDTATGSRWTYSKEPGAPAPAITANDAFSDSCRP